MRTQSTLLVRDATQVLDSYSADHKADLNVSLSIVTDLHHLLVAEKANSPRELCHQLALTLHIFSNTLMRNLQRFIEAGDSSGVETIWTCCVICLGHLTALSHLIGQKEPTLRGPMDSLYDLTLDKLGDLSHDVYVEVYSYFDVLTKVLISAVSPRVSMALTGGADQISWERALDTIDVCMMLFSHAESELLRYCRGVIWKSQADFQAKLLGCGTSPLVLWVMLVDGRTEGSDFPNLALPAGREPYGLAPTPTC